MARSITEAEFVKEGLLSAKPKPGGARPSSRTALDDFLDSRASDNVDIESKAEKLANEAESKANKLRKDRKRRAASN